MTGEPIHALRERLDTALRSAIGALPAQIGDEHLYAFSLYTSGDSDFCYACFSANTEEALVRAAAEYAARDVEYAGDEGKRLLRWSTPDWGYHDFAPGLADLGVPVADDRPDGMDAAIYDVFVSSLRALDREGAFGVGSAREKITLNVVCGDMSEDFFRHGLTALNPQVVVDRYLEESTPEPFIRTIGQRPLAEQAEVWLELYEGLMLRRESSLIAQARAAGFSVYDAAEQLEKSAHPSVAPALVDIIERHGFLPAFNDEGTPEWERDGAFTPASKLATGAVFILARIGAAPDASIDRLLAILGRRVELDAHLPLVSTLAENIARCLHTLRPDVFPPSELHPETNHLVNAKGFLRST